MEHYTATVVGCGSGGKLSIKALEASERFELVGVTDLRPEVCDELKTAYPHLRTFPSYEEMFSECPADIVCISTWPPSHKEITIKALTHPLKGILVEKPLGDTFKAGCEIVKAVKTKQIPMAVPHNLVVGGYARDIITRVHNGDIGELELVEIECDKWDIINAGIHWMNFFITLVRNEPVSHVLATCDSSTRTYRDNMQVETEAVTYVVTENGIRAVMNTGDYIKTIGKGKGTLFRLIGTKGSIEFWNMDSTFRLVNREFPEGKVLDIGHDERSKHQIHLEVMAQQIDSGKLDYSIAEISLKALEICEASYLSNRYRCKVEFPLEQFTPPEPNDWDPGKPYSGTGGGRDGRKLTS